MGAGASATQMVFFITSVIIALSVVGAIFLNIQSISSAAIMGSKTFAEQLKTDITIISDSESIPYNSSSGIYTFYVKNTGKEELGIQYITVMIDGTIVSDSNLNKTILGNDPMWLSGDVLQINATTSLSASSHNIRVITANGIEDTFSFRIP